MLRALTFAALAILVCYGLVKALPLISGPRIVLSSPAEGQAFPDGSVEVKGTAVHTENLALNGAPLLIDEHGRFDTTLTLPRGGAILSLTATDRFGKTERMTRAIFVPNP
jgi:hypothetical protein